jgi:hypothetical protein
LRIRSSEWPRRRRSSVSAGSPEASMGGST